MRRTDVRLASFLISCLCSESVNLVYMSHNNKRTAKNKMSMRSKKQPVCSGWLTTRIPPGAFWWTGFGAHDGGIGLVSGRTLEQEGMQVGESSSGLRLISR